MDVKYQQAIDLKIAAPEQTWEQIAELINVSPRQLRRVRESPEWAEAWAAADKVDMIEALRRKALGENNASFFKVYFDVVGISADEDVLGTMLGMSDQQALEIARDAKEWYEAVHKVSGG